MTLADERTKKCAVCKKKSKHWVLYSTSSFGSPDLDTRLPEPARFTLDSSIESCPHCGYCTQDISEKIPGAKKMVKSDRYKNYRNNKIFSELATRYLCSSIISKNNKNYSKAGWECLSAAWVCDDRWETDNAKKCRLAAINFFQKARQKKQAFAEKSDEEPILIIDLLRRSGKFSIAQQECKKLINLNYDDLLKKIIKFQLKLIEEKNNECFTIEDAQLYQENCNLKKEIIVLFSPLFPDNRLPKFIEELGFRVLYCRSQNLAERIEEFKAIISKNDFDLAIELQHKDKHPVLENLEMYKKTAPVLLMDQKLNRSPKNKNEIGSSKYTESILKISEFIPKANKALPDFKKNIMMKIIKKIIDINGMEQFYEDDSSFEFKIVETKS